MKKIFKSAILGIATIASSFLPSLTAQAESQTAVVNASIDEKISLVLSKNSINLDLSDQAFHMDNLVVNGTTNNPNGYTISFNINNDHNDLKHSNPLVENKISSITEDVSKSVFPNAAWGYSLDEETFKQIPLGSENIFETGEKGSGEYSFTIGAKAASELAAGSYENELIFTIVAKPDPIITLSMIDNMQQISTQICANSAIHETKQLKDTRDGKYYWVTKAKDNNCWMTQNLDYDLSVEANQTLSPATSNVTETRTVIPDNSGVSTWSADSNAKYYLDGGDVYYAGGTTRTDGYSNLPANDEQRHYHIGDFYSWRAATAGVGVGNSSTRSDVTESICPAGWRMPQTNAGSAVQYSLGNAAGEYGKIGYLADYYTILNPPLYFITPRLIVREGAVIDSWNAYWTSSDKGGTTAGDFCYNAKNIYADCGDTKDIGMFIRCAAI